MNRPGEPPRPTRRRCGGPESVSDQPAFARAAPSDVARRHPDPPRPWPSRPAPTFLRPHPHGTQQEVTDLPGDPTPPRAAARLVHLLPVSKPPTRDRRVDKSIDRTKGGALIRTAIQRLRRVHRRIEAKRKATGWTYRSTLERELASVSTSVTEPDETLGAGLGLQAGSRTDQLELHGKAQVRGPVQFERRLSSPVRPAFVPRPTRHVGNLRGPSGSHG